MLVQPCAAARHRKVPAEEELAKLRKLQAAIWKPPETQETDLMPRPDVFLGPTAAKVAGKEVRFNILEHHITFAGLSTAQPAWECCARHLHCAGGIKKADQRKITTKK